MPLADPTPLVSRVPVVPVLTIEAARDAIPLASALRAGGLAVIEVTLRTTAALAAIRAIATEMPDVVVGAGTVLTPADIAAAVEAGARYLVSPGTPDELAGSLAASALPAIPGCATVTEAMALAARGFNILKFFPAEASFCNMRRACSTSGALKTDEAATSVSAPDSTARRATPTLTPPSTSILQEGQSVRKCLIFE